MAQYNLEQIETIGVIGAGTMGAGIAQMTAMHGYRTYLYDIKQKALNQAEKTVTKNIDKGIELGKVTTDFSDLEVDLAIEAIVESLEAKQEVFTDLADQNTKSTILATNTSSLPITKVAKEIPHPERVVGMHFFNPAHIMKLVEVISSVETDPAVAKTVQQLAEKIGKKAAFAKDSPGFIVNRVARHFYVESLKILEENVTDHASIDTIVESTGFKMGPFRLMDLIGVDSNHLVTKRMFESFYYASKFRPSRIQEQKVNAGHHGRKTGRGFYKYDG